MDRFSLQPPHRHAPAWACASSLIAYGALWTAAAPAAPAHHVAGAVVALTTQPGSTLERDATTLVADDLGAAKKAHEVPVMLVGSARLAGPKTAAALFVQVQSASLCGSAGCSTSVFVKHGHEWKRVLDSVSGPIKVSPSSHQGMHDLLVHGTDRWVWTGESYTDTLPAPKVELK
jgi:hypothetical protein